MAQIIKHRRGSLEALSAVTSSLVKGELVIASGSSNLTVTNGSSLVFTVPADGQVQATNRFLIGDAAPNTFAGSTYNGMLKGVPYYASGSSTLYLLGTDGNDAINLVGNIQPFSASVATSINALSASIGGGSIGSAVTALNAFSASTLIRLNNLESTSASVNGHIADINTKTGSFEGKFTTLGTYTASVDSKFGEIHSYTSSLRTAFTASGANVTFSGNVTIPGNLTVTGTQTIVDSTTVQIGDNIIELNGSGATNGGLWVKDATNPNNATGSIIWDSTNDYWKAGVKGSEVRILLAGGDGVVSGSSQITISDTTGYSTFSSSIATNVVELFSTASDHESRIDVIEASVGGGGSVATRIDQLAAATASVNSFTASAENRLNNLESTSASVNGHISDINTWSGSAKTSITNLETKAGTLSTYTASVDGHISDINTWSASVKGHISDINSYTSSNNTTNTAQNNRLSSIETFTSSFGTTFSSSVDSRLDTLEGTGTIQGVGTGNNVTFASLTTTNNVTIGGDLVVQGNTVTLNTATLVVEDKTIQLASGSANAAASNGAGIEVMGASATFTYDSTPNAWTANIPISASAFTGSFNLPTGGSSKRIAFRTATGNLDLVTAPSTIGDVLQWNGTDFVMSNTIDGGSF